MPLDYELPDGVVVKRSPRARRVALRLDSKERAIYLVVPERMPMQRALNFAYGHRHWIAEKLAELPERIPFYHGNIIPVLGRERKLHISYDEDLKRTDIVLEPDEMFVLTNKDDPAGRISRYLKNLAQENLTALAHDKAAQINRDIGRISVRDTKSRWGSCGPDGQISFSWRLVLAPYEAMDYVVAHEVAHLVHMDHSKDFWAVCADLSQSYGRGKKWIRNHGHSLHRYG